MKLHECPRTCVCSRCQPQPARCPMDLFVGDDNSFPGVTTVDTTFAEPGPLETYTEGEMESIQQWVARTFR